MLANIIQKCVFLKLFVVFNWFSSKSSMPMSLTHCPPFLETHFWRPNRVLSVAYFKITWTETFIRCPYRKLFNPSEHRSNRFQTGILTPWCPPGGWQSHFYKTLKCRSKTLDKDKLAYKTCPKNIQNLQGAPSKNNLKKCVFLKLFFVVNSLF